MAEGRTAPTPVWATQKGEGLIKDLAGQAGEIGTEFSGQIKDISVKLTEVVAALFLNKMIALSQEIFPATL